MKPGITISCVAHAVALGFAVVAISAQPMESPPVDTIATQIVSDKDFSQMTKGVKNAPQLKIPDLKPLADKVDQEKSVDQLAPKAVDKPPVTTDSSKADTTKPDQPKPEQQKSAAAQADPKPPDPKPDPKPDAKADPKPDQKPDQKLAEKPKPPEYKPDQIASLLKKDAAKEAKTDNSAQQKQNSPKFDANQVAQLLDKRAPQRQLASASQTNNVAALGAATGAQDAQLSQSEIDALRARISSCWNLPPGIDKQSKLYVVLHVSFRPDGSLGAEPTPVEGSASSLGPALAESAKRALLSCQPFTMLKPEHYGDWKELEFKFNPLDLFGG